MEILVLLLYVLRRVSDIFITLKTLEKYFYENLWKFQNPCKSHKF